VAAPAVIAVAGAVPVAPFTLALSIVAAVATVSVPRKAAPNGFTPASSRPAPTSVPVVAVIVTAVVAVIAPRMIVCSS
jgi:hypothetical protein